jgi:sialate O-acetylesterase
MFGAARALFISGMAIALPLGAALAQAPDFAPRFADRMVLQQGAPITVAGTAAPDAKVEVSLGAASASAAADSAGNWQATIPAQGPARNLSLTATTSEGTASRADIHIGDVFLCSGQSNMAHPVIHAMNPDQELAGPFSADLRLLKVPQKSSAAPEPALPEGSVWQAADRDSVSGFSAICYFFGRSHQARTGHPVGLIDSSWGGSRIEAWISPASLASDPQFSDGLALLKQYALDPAPAIRGYGANWEKWWASISPNYAPWLTGLGAPKRMPGEMRDWKTYGDPDLETHFGIVWFERTFTLPADAATGPATLSLGAMDEIDSVWVNGAFIGTTFGWGTPRTYTVPAGILKPGENRITVNVHNSWGAGGMTGPDAALNAILEDGTLVPLWGSWSYEKVPTSHGTPPVTPWSSVSGLSGMHHAMIAPLAGLRFAGALWYQGESNTGEAENYKDLLDRLAADLRGQFGAELPVLVFQLPEFGEKLEKAGNSGWSSLRDAQRRFVEGDVRSGLVVALGAGDEWDIHPPNKQEPARRAATVWDAIGTGSPVRTGYSPESMSRKGRTLRITLPEATGPYTTPGTNQPVGFAVCTSAGSCSFHTATLSGRTIELKKVPKGTNTVRYCWGDTPFCNLTAADGTPVTPFELRLP